MDIKNLLFDLTNKTGISGFEFEFSNYVKQQFDRYCDKVYIDKFGNVIAMLNQDSKGTKLMLEAHIDEIGLIVSDIKESGRVHFETIGGIDPAILPASEVIIHGKDDIYGVIGAKPPHLQTKKEEDKAYKLKDLYIDAGLSYDEIVKIIQIGNPISLKSKSISMLNQVVSSKSIDNRAGIAILIECAKILKEENFKGPIVFLAAVQEELGLRGATIGTYNIKPDKAVAIDVTHGITPMVTASEGFALGSGVAIGVGPNIDQDIANSFVNIAKEKNIPYTIEVCAGSTGTDAWAIQVQLGGVPTGLLSVPLKYMHSHIETVDIIDVSNTVKLLSMFAKGEGIC